MNNAGSGTYVVIVNYTDDSQLLLEEALDVVGCNLEEGAEAFGSMDLAVFAEMVRSDLLAGLPPAHTVEVEAEASIEDTYLGVKFTINGPCLRAELGMAIRAESLDEN